MSSMERGGGSEEKKQEQNVFQWFWEVGLCCGGRRLGRSQFIHVPQTPRAAPPLFLATPAVSLVPSQPKRRIWVRKPLQIRGLVVLHRWHSPEEGSAGICSGSSSPHAPHGTSCVILPRQTFHCSVSPLSPRETGRKFHPFAPLLKTSWN